MYIAPPDRTLGPDEWRPFVEAQGFGHLVAAGDRSGYPVVVPTQFVLRDADVLFHVARPNPVLDALAADPRAVLSVAGDWAYVPSSWKAIGDEDPALGIPTTYYAAVQLKGRVQVIDDAEEIAEVLRQQLAVIQPTIPAADPLEAHRKKLATIRALVLAVDEVSAKFKYGGNADAAHRQAVIERLGERGGPGDAAAAAHTARRLASG